jgi:hypothetical protein
MSDSRFDTSNPLFKKSLSKRNKIVVDDRFKSVLDDERFHTTPGKIDKYGRKLKNSVKNQQKELSEFYEIEKETSADNSSHINEVKSDKKVRKSEKSIDKKKEIKSSNSNNKDESRLDYLIKLSRGEVENDSSSDDDDDEDDDDSNMYDDDYNNNDNDSDDSDTNNNIEQDHARLIKNKNNSSKSPLDVDDRHEIQLLEGESTNRLAIQNCDWENLKAKDLL